MEPPKKRKISVKRRNLLPLYGSLTISNLKQYFDTSKKEFFEQFAMKKAVPTVSTKRFEIICTIGKGAFSSVQLAKHKINLNYYAMKTILRKTISLTRVVHIVSEKQVLQSIDFPFCIRMEYFCKDSTYIYFVMPFVNGGDLYFHLRSKCKFEENLSCFYAAQVVLALEYLQYLRFVYRDLKPENILLDHLGYIKITDFGLTKLVENRTYTFCGTPPYIAPEIIQGWGYAKSVDWWALGILIYEMSTGSVPFKATRTTRLYKAIIQNPLKLPRDLSLSLKSILRRLLQKDVTKRLGNMKYGVREVKKAKWFSDIDWMLLLNRQIQPPFIPECSHPADVSNFIKGRSAQVDETIDTFKDF